MKKRNTLRENFKRLAKVVRESHTNEIEKNDLLLFIDRRVEQINKKASGISTKEKENKLSQDQIKAILFDLLAQQSEPINIATIMKIKPLNQCTSQRISATLFKLILENKVERIVVNTISFYAIAKETETTEE